jgi:hypothetical protein
MNYQCPPNPLVTTMFDSQEFVAYRDGFKAGKGPTEDVAVSNYYALNSLYVYPRPNQGARMHPHITGERNGHQ